MSLKYGKLNVHTMELNHWSFGKYCECCVPMFDVHDVPIEFEVRLELHYNYKFVVLKLLMYRRLLMSHLCGLMSFTRKTGTSFIAAPLPQRL